MEFELPVAKPTKAEFLGSVEAILVPRGFERKGQKFTRKPEGYVRAQVVDFMASGGDAGHFILAPYLVLKGKPARGQAALRKHVSGALLADFGRRAGIERANHISYYDNWFSAADWLGLFERVLNGVLENLEPIMRDKASLEEFLDRAYSAARVVHLGTKQTTSS